MSLHATCPTSPMKPDGGFTLVELLVVVSIMAILLAMLIPTMDRAVYQAELTACSATLKGVVTGTTSYAMDQRRHYPTRPQDLDPVNTTEQTIYIGATGAWYDLRRIVSGYIQPQQFLCPLSGKVNLVTTQTDTTVYGSYGYWAGWNYNGMPGLKRMGDRWEWAYNGPAERFSLLVGDRDVIDYGGAQVQSTHPDRDGYVDWNVQCRDGTNHPWGNVKLTIAMWYTNKGFHRSPVDRNFGYPDGSVIRHNDIAIDSSGWPVDERFTTVGMYNSATSGTNGLWHDITPREE